MQGLRHNPRSGASTGMRAADPSKAPRPSTAVRLLRRDHMNPLPEARIQALEDVATRLRIDSIRATTAAKSGHPSSSASAADLVAAIFFDAMRFDPDEPRALTSDRFVLSKGHAAPLLYAEWAEVGAIKREELTTLRDIESDLEGHPTPRLPFVDVATGSLGQGLGVGIGLAL